jgi:predicted transcriptional regulator
MDIQANKLEIIEWLAGINDSSIIRRFMLLKKSTEELGKASLSSSQKQAIDEGLRSIEKGDFKVHEEVIECTKEKYPDLFKDSAR